jgi:hypothetical protein
VAFSDESLVTPFTIVIALVSMASQVDLEVTFLSEAFSADVADERFEPLMFSEVY